MLANRFTKSSWLLGMLFIFLLVSEPLVAGAIHRTVKSRVLDTWKIERAKIVKACQCKRPLRLHFDWKSYKDNVDAEKAESISVRLENELSEIRKVYTGFCQEKANRKIACHRKKRITVKIAWGDFSQAKVDEKKRRVWEYTDDKGYSAAQRLRTYIYKMD